MLSICSINSFCFVFKRVLFTNKLGSNTFLLYLSYSFNSNLNHETQIHTTNAFVEKLPHNIIRVEYKKDYVATLADGIEVEKAFLSLAEEEDLYCLFTTIDGPIEFTDEALDFMANSAESIPRMKGFAMVLANLSHRILARVFTKFHKPKYPTKVFKNKDMAISWLKSLQE